jgi:hypothetical protein
MSRKKKGTIKISLSNKKKSTGHTSHRSGSGQHDNREKRMRTRQNIVKREIDERSR